MVAVKDMEMPSCCFNCDMRIDGYSAGYYCEITNEELNGNSTLKHRASNCPLVEIVTCKDCKYYREDDDTGYCTNHTCGDIVFWCRDDYYCADAQRKDVTNG